jgi:hypothetical protein
MVGRNKDPLISTAIAMMFVFVTLTLITAGCRNNDNSDFYIRKSDGSWVCEHTGPYGSVRAPVLYDCEHVLSGKKVKSITVTLNDTVYELSENTK